jgi:cytochrome c oxidase cbb3-type subunit 2
LPVSRLITTSSKTGLFRSALRASLRAASWSTKTSVAPPGFGSDTERKWGDRQSYARDYIHQDRVQLGLSRVGPDLTNVGARLKSASDVYKLLYQGTATMPAYPFLFEERLAQSEPSPKAVAKVAGREIVPTPRAEVLAAYLLSLNTPADYPVEKADNTIAPAKKEGEHK